MVLTRPITKTVISTTEFGQPVYDWIVANTPTPWTAFTFQNGWLSHHPGNASAYRKVGDIVYLRGTVYNGTLGAAVTTLPPGFRPPLDMFWSSLCYTGAPTDFVTTRIEIHTDGVMQIRIAAGGTNQWIPINLSFSTTS